MRPLSWPCWHPRLDSEVFLIENGDAVDICTLPDKIIGMVNGDWINQASQFRSMVQQASTVLAQLGLALGAPVVFADLLSQSGIFLEPLRRAFWRRAGQGKKSFGCSVIALLMQRLTPRCLMILITPNHRHFVRNNGLIPDRAKRAIFRTGRCESMARFSRCLTSTWLHSKAVSNTFRLRL